MQTRFPTLKQDTASVLLTFFTSGLCNGVLFAWLVTRPSLNSSWFTRQEFWELPTWKFWILSASIFLLSLATAYAFSYVKRWLWIPLHRAVLGLIVFAGAALPFWFMGRLTPISYFIFTRLFEALLLSSALFATTRRWRTSVFLVILTSCVLAPLIAGIPHAFVRSFTNVQFEGLKFLIMSPLLSVLSGYWLVSTNEQGKEGKSKGSQ